MQAPASVLLKSPSVGTRLGIPLGWKPLHWGCVVLLTAFPALMKADGVISSCTEAEFRAALLTGGDVTFAKNCQVTLSEPVVVYAHTSIDANDFSVSIIGNGSFRLFDVAPGVNFTLNGLTLQQGSNAQGGAIYIDSTAVVRITNCTFSANSASGAAGTNGDNGKDSSSGNATDGLAGMAGNPGMGGAVYNLGDLVIEGSRFLTNTVSGGSGGNGGTGGSGAWNVGSGGNGGSGASGGGGAIYNVGKLGLTNCTFAYNTASGGGGGSGGAKGPHGFGGLAGEGGVGASARGGAVFSTNLIDVANCTFSGNRASGGGTASGGSDNNLNGMDGARGGGAYGGGIANQGEASFINCTLSGNTAQGGPGGKGGNGASTAGNGGNGGDAYGGGIYNTNTTSLLHCTVANCSAIGGTNGLAGSGAFAGQPGTVGRSRGSGVSNGGGAFNLKNTILGTNSVGGVGYGTFVDQGNNISADKTLVLGASSKVNTDPKLGPLAANGGPTQTMLPLPGSPAVHAADLVEGLDVDQRGLPRPATLDVPSDIGAVEGQPPKITTQPENQSAGLGASAVFVVSALGDGPLFYLWIYNGTIQIRGATNTAYTLTSTASTNVGSYTAVVTNAFGSATSNPAMLSLGAPPTILTQPTNQFSVQGGNVQFSILASGLAPLTYQWKKDAKVIVGATGTFLLLTNVQITNGGNYTVAVSNPNGSTSSQPALLEVHPLTTIGVSSSLLTVSIPTATNHNYVLSYRTNLLEGIWVPLQTNVGTGNPILFQEPTTNGPSRFYKTELR